MKILTLNTWGGKIYKPLEEFIKKYQDVDVFCLQETYHDGVGKEKDEDHLEDAFDLFTDLQRLLPNHVGFFRDNVDGYYGNSMFVKNIFAIKEEGEHFVYRQRGYVPPEDMHGNHARNMQFVTIEKDETPFTIFNIHGLWNGMGKTDTQDRLDQSNKIVAFTKKFQNEFVVCGDFNLRPDTESVKILENAGLRNLVKEYNITSTRTSHYTKPEKFADYIFTTKGIDVIDFKVLPDEVSDHAALYLEIK
jgi:endonuclease/exonuclease/phosphatase family metal-dependent hydrolase